MDNDEVKSMSQKKAKARMDTGRVIVLDVREPYEYAELHIPNSILIPLDELEKEAGSKLVNKSAEILVYCKSGRRSAEAAMILSDMGYTQVYNIGGLVDWEYERESGEYFD